jgi:predicted tellurium resistance membrane protein TerC
MAKHIEIMIVAVIISVGTMIAVAGSIGRFIDRHPAIKVLALAFLILIGVVLVSESIEKSIPKGYVYFAMAFSLAVEMVNMRAGTRSTPATR